MNRQSTSRGRSFGKGVATRREKIPVASSPTPLLASRRSEPLLQRKYRELIRQHLGKLLDSLFAELTGLHFHIAWAPSRPREWDTRKLPTACSVCCRLRRSPLLPDCEACGPKQLARALGADGRGHRFTCRLGVRNYWIPIRVRSEMLGIAYLQALENSPPRLLAGKRSARALPTRLYGAGARVLSRVRFAGAARFLWHIVQHVQSATLSDLRKADLTSAGRALVALEKEQARLHLTLKRYLPPSLQTSRRSEPESHAQQIVRRLLERLELDYGKTVTLQQYSRELGMNAAYVSGLFARAVGVPFKAYLTDLRLERAKALLTDPAKTASEVAYAVGYSSVDRFRSAFKKVTGLCPRLWRETMQMNPSPSPP